VERALVARRQEKKGVLDVEIASEILKALLDPSRYSLKWKPSTEDNNPPGGCSSGDFPHLHAFREYLKTEPVKIITKDQWDQFYEFTASVSWDLKEHSEESACKLFSSGDGCRIGG
jgi:hypothetical protein